MQNRFVDPKPTIAELEQKPKECEAKAATESEPKAGELREEAKKYKHWIALIRSGQWTA